LGLDYPNLPRQALLLIPLFRPSPFLLQITYQLHSLPSVYFRPSCLLPFSIYAFCVFPGSGCSIFLSPPTSLSSHFCPLSRLETCHRFGSLSRGLDPVGESRWQNVGWEMTIWLYFSSFLFFLVILAPLPAPILDGYPVRTLLTQTSLPASLLSVSVGVMRCVAGRTVTFHRHFLRPVSPPRLPPYPYLPAVRL